MTSVTEVQSVLQAQVSQTVGKTESDTGFYDILNQGLKNTTEDMDTIFEEASAKYQISVDLLKAVAKVESSFNPNAVSSAGAMGVMQLMPGTAKSLGVSDPFDARQNIMGGAKYLRQNLDKYNGNLELTLAAYNAGPGNVDRCGGIPFTCTQNYVNKVISYMNGNPLYANKTVQTGGSSEKISNVNTNANITLNSLLGNGTDSYSAMSSLLGLGNTNSYSAISSLLGTGNSSSYTAVNGYGGLANYIGMNGYSGLDNYTTLSLLIDSLKALQASQSGEQAQNQDTIKENQSAIDGAYYADLVQLVRYQMMSSGQMIGSLEF